MPCGYNGTILHVNLSSRKHYIETQDEDFYKTYFGGSALALYYLLNHLKAGVDPLGPDNVLVFACSAITGAPFSGFSRFTVAAKSPLTGAFGESEAGGYFGPELKFSGFDAIVIKGKADVPVYLWLHDNQVEIRDAKHLWGKENSDTLDSIRSELKDPKIRVASIGPSGEKQSLLSNILNELVHANGRTGLGAVMGSKNLKAIACRGYPEKINFADSKKVKQLVSWHSDRIKNHEPSKAMGKFGTPMHVLNLNKSGILPTRNWQQGVFENADKIGVTAYERILKRRGTCYRCSVACKRVVELTEPYQVNGRYGGPEYETIAAFGSSCGVDDLFAISKANEICNRFGLDTISTGAAIAFTMECFEKGILNDKDNDGRAIHFGDADGMVALVQKIASLEGLGKTLAAGVKRAASKIGHGAERYAFTIKGQEIPFHDPRGKTGVALSYAVSPTGADHLEAPHETPFQGEGVEMILPLSLNEPPDLLALDESKVNYFKRAQLTWSMNNTLGICNFVMAPLFTLSYEKLIEAVKAITGWKTNLEELLRCAERSIVMARIFNHKEGFGPEDDILFRRLHQPIPKGPAKGQSIDRNQFEQAVKSYYKMMGWNENGVPGKDRIVDLGLEWLF